MASTLLLFEFFFYPKATLYLKEFLFHLLFFLLFINLLLVFNPTLVFSRNTIESLFNLIYYSFIIYHYKFKIGKNYNSYTN
jgi:hypothetical protein